MRLRNIAAAAALVATGALALTACTSQPDYNEDLPKSVVAVCVGIKDHVRYADDGCTAERLTDGRAEWMYVSVTSKLPAVGATVSKKATTSLAKGSTVYNGAPQQGGKVPLTALTPLSDSTPVPVTTATPLATPGTNQWGVGQDGAGQTTRPGSNG